MEQPILVTRGLFILSIPLAIISIVNTVLVLNYLPGLYLGPWYGCISSSILAIITFIGGVFKYHHAAFLKGLAPASLVSTGLSVLGSITSIFHYNELHNLAACAYKPLIDTTYYTCDAHGVDDYSTELNCDGNTQFYEAASYCYHHDYINGRISKCACVSSHNKLCYDIEYTPDCSHIFTNYPPFLLVSFILTILCIFILIVISVITVKYGYFTPLLLNDHHTRHRINELLEIGTQASTIAPEDHRKHDDDKDGDADEDNKDGFDLDDHMSDSHRYNDSNNGCNSSSSSSSNSNSSSYTEDSNHDNIKMYPLQVLYQDELDEQKDNEYTTYITATTAYTATANTATISNDNTIIIGKSTIPSLDLSPNNSEDLNHSTISMTHLHVDTRNQEEYNNSSLVMLSQRSVHNILHDGSSSDTNFTAHTNFVTTDTKMNIDNNANTNCTIIHMNDILIKDRMS